MAAYQQYFHQRIELERQEEMNRHIMEIESMSGERREAKGRAVLKLDGKDGGRGLGGTYLVRLVREGGLPKTNISNGDLVLLSKGKPTGKEPQATVVAKSRFSITVAFLNPPPRFVFIKKVRLDLFANDIVFQRMEAALEIIGKREEWVEVLLGREMPAFDLHAPEPIQWRNPDLNYSQKEAVVRGLRARQAFMLHGPPGTGKTTTLVELIGQEIERGSFVLATADSNVAVDNLVEKLAGMGRKVLRIGNPARVNERLMEYALDEKVLAHPAYQKAQQYYREIDQLKDQQQEYDRPSGPNRRGLTDRQILDLARRKQGSRGVPAAAVRSMAQWLRTQRRMNSLFDEAKALGQEATVDLLSEAEVVCTTHASAGSETLRDSLFYAGKKVDVVMVDEASQAMEPTSLISLVYGRRFVMAGDDRQLPPTVLSPRAQEVLQLTLFERLRHCFDPGVSHMLRIQYRMHEHIMQFSNRRFYEGRLEAHPSVKRHTLAGLDGVLAEPAVPLGDTLSVVIDPNLPVVFVDTAAMNGPGEEQPGGSYSYHNPAEAALVSEVYHALLMMELSPEQIGIISPYEKQVDRLQDLLGADERLEIKTVDGFQGREKEAIIVSLVRSNEEQNIGFLRDLRRLNVAITRARRKLVVIGHRPTLEAHPAYAELLDTQATVGGHSIRRGAGVN